MKNILLLTLAITPIILFTACGDNTAAPPEADYAPGTQDTGLSSSMTDGSGATSSSSVTYVPPVVSSSSIAHVQPPLESSSSATYYWAFEIGNVCKGYNIDVAIDDPSRPVEAYAALYKICGDRANVTYPCEPTERSAEHILRFVDNATAMQLVDMASKYGAAFGFYNAKDGYLRYIYFEACYDGQALLKRN